MQTPQVQEIEKSSQSKIYVAHPYTPYERGLNENTNGLIRQSVAKKRSIIELTNWKVKIIAIALNTRPRKSLQFDTPANLLYSQFKLT